MDIFTYNMQKFGNPMGLQPPPGDPPGVGQPKPPVFPPQGLQAPQFGASGLGPMAAPAPQAAPQPDPFGGVLGALDRAFGGPDMENLSPKARRQVRRQGLLTMAAQMLTATDPRGRRAQGLAPLGQAIFAGQQAYGQGLEQAQGQVAAEEQAKFFQEIAPRPGESNKQRLERLHSMLNWATANGKQGLMQPIAMAIQSTTSLLEDEMKAAKPAAVRAGDMLRGGDGFWYKPDPNSPDGYVRTSIPAGKDTPPKEPNIASIPAPLKLMQDRYDEVAKVANSDPPKPPDIAAPQAVQDRYVATYAAWERKVQRAQQQLETIAAERDAMARRYFPEQFPAPPAAPPAAPAEASPFSPQGQASYNAGGYNPLNIFAPRR